MNKMDELLNIDITRRDLISMILGDIVLSDEAMFYISDEWHGLYMNPYKYRFIAELITECLDEKGLL